MKEGIIRFHGYCIEEMSYYRNNNYEANGEYIDISPEFLFKLIVKEDMPERYNLIVGARIGYSNDNLPFKAEVVLRGYFETKDIEYSRETLQSFYIINSSAILFPYLRSTLTDITSKSDHAPIILPTFNFHTVIDGSSIEDLMINSSEYREYE